MQRRTQARRGCEVRSSEASHGAAPGGGAAIPVPRASRVVSPGGNLLDAAQVAADLLIPLATLRRMAAKGEYPELLHVTRGQYRVRAAEHESWMASRWTKAEEARASLAWERVRAQILTSRG